VHDGTGNRQAESKTEHKGFIPDLKIIDPDIALSLGALTMVPSGATKLKGASAPVLTGKSANMYCMSRPASNPLTT
jgi:hypothetical protein